MEELSVSPKSWRKTLLFQNLGKSPSVSVSMDIIPATSSVRTNMRADTGIRESDGQRDEDVNVLTMSDAETGQVLNAVSSETAVSVLSMLSESSKVSKEIAESLDMSVQNVRYHLNKLEDAGLIETDGIRYSERGREMSVYRVAESPTVIVLGDEERLEDVDG